MKKKEWNEGLNCLDSDLVEEYVDQKDRLGQRNKKQKSVWLRFGAIAACFLIVSAIIVVPMLREDEPGIEPYSPNGDPWSPIINPSVEEVILSADQVGSIFDVMKDSNGTNQYTKVYVSDPKHLDLMPLPTAEYLPIYSSKDFEPSETDLQEFIDEYLDETTTFLDIKPKDYDIESGELWNGNIYYEAEIRDEDDRKYIYFIAKDNLLFFNHNNLDERRLRINGNMISILESDTDEQIKEKLKGTISYMCKLYGKDYSDIKICRKYSYRQLETIIIYLYSIEETIYPEDFSEAPMASDYISLTFNTDWGSGTYCSWGGSEEEAFLTKVSLYKAAHKWNDYYKVESKAKMLTLKEAEALLEKGYVFGGHSCPLCMAEQPEVDFSDYTYVDIEYESDRSGGLCIPFYAFYKYIGETNYGIDTYAKTYVPAVQVSGYEEYFESQKNIH